VKENLIKDYPFPAMETYSNRKLLPTMQTRRNIYISAYDIKNNTDYSA
jgi:hypothetical protein